MLDILAFLVAVNVSGTCPTSSSFSSSESAVDYAELGLRVTDPVRVHAPRLERVRERQDVCISN